MAVSTKWKDRDARSGGRGGSQQASPDEVTVSHAIGCGLFVEICHLLLVQFVHVHLHVCTKRKAVRGQSQARGQGEEGSALEVRDGGRPPDWRPLLGGNESAHLGVPRLAQGLARSGHNTCWGWGGQVM